MSSDTGEYDQQVSKIRKQIRGMKSKKGLRPGEYLYGFRKNNRLYPVITFVIYYGEARGIAIGETRRENRLNNLNLHLINENRYDDLERAANDTGFRKKLFAEFNL